jgi:DNA replication protein DnaC
MRICCWWFDFGTEPAAGSRYADLLSIIDRAAGKVLHTLIASNAEPYALRETYDERLLSRLMGSSRSIAFLARCPSRTEPQTQELRRWLYAVAQT